VRARGGRRSTGTLPVEIELGGLGTHELRGGADILGTVRITEPDAFLDMLLEVCALGWLTQPVCAKLRRTTTRERSAS
jgi:hypothetical protein